MIFRYPGAMAEIPYAPADIKVLPSWLLGRAAERGRRLVADALAGVGLRLAHHAVLSAIAELGPVSQADLVRKLGIDPKDMVTILDEIQAAGLVTRAPDPADRRKNSVTASAEGVRLLRRTRRLSAEANDDLVSGLSPAERRQLSGLLTRIITGPDA